MKYECNKESVVGGNWFQKICDLVLGNPIDIWIFWVI